MSRCRCGSGRTYKRCCEPLHSGRAAPNPEALMRSRYCAYALGLADYILDTTDPAGPHFEADTAAWRASVARFSADTRFLGLSVRSASEDGDTGEVRFVATLERDGQDSSFGETSAFIRVRGRWLYRSGSRS